jgi:hypothetical protein
MDLVMDQAIALFAGINVVPKRSYLASYSSRIDHKACLPRISHRTCQARAADMGK